MIPVSAPEIAVLTARKYRTYLKIEIADALGVYQDYSNFGGLDLQYRAEVSVEVDARIKGARLELVRQSGNQSWAPLLNSDIDVGRGVRVKGARVAAGATPGPSDFKPLLEGSIDEWGHPTVNAETDDNSVQLVARDNLAALQDREIEEPTDYGSEEGVALEAVMQAILDDWADGIELYVPVATGIAAGPFRQAKAPVLEAIQMLADRIGWVIEDRWDSVTSAWRITLYEPNRTPSGTDWTFGPNDYLEVTQLGVKVYHIRNAVKVSFTDAATGERDYYLAEDPVSIAKYGRRFMEIAEASDSPINSLVRAQGMADPAVSDLAEPDAVQQIVAPFFPPIQLGDFYGFEPNGVHYDVGQEFGVTGYTHVLENGEGTTQIRTSGKPVGSVRGWLKHSQKARPPKEVEKASEILNFRIIGRTETPPTVTYGWTLGSDLKMSAIHNYTEKQPFAVDKWPDEDRVPDAILFDRDVEYTLAVPDPGYDRYFQVEGRRADGSLGDMERAMVYPPGTPGDYIAFAAATVNQADGSVSIVGFTGDRALSVAFAYNVGPAGSTSPPTQAQTEAQGAGADGGGLLTGFTSDFEITLPAGTVGFGQVIRGLLIAYLNPDGTGADGTATDHDTPVGFQGERFKITDPDQITDGIVIARKINESSRSYGHDLVFSAPDWDTVAWSAGTLRLSDGTEYAIAAGNTGNLASDAVRFIYFDSTISPTVLQVATAALGTIGENAVYLASAKRASTGSGGGELAYFRPGVGVLSLNGDQLSPSSIRTQHLTADSVLAGNIDVDYLRAISADLGNIISGYISNPTNTAAIKLSASTADPDGIPALPATNFIDLTATGTDPFIKHPALELLANGDAVFSGEVAASLFTAPAAVFNGTLQVDDDALFLGVLQHDGSQAGFFGTTAVGKPTVSGARDDPEGALKSLLQALHSLVGLGLINDTTTAT